MADAQSQVSDRIKKWELTKIIPDVVHQLAPQFGSLGVVYNDTQVSDGLPMRKAQTSARPHVVLQGAIDDETSLYSLVMVDPDPPSPDNPIYRHWLHWAVVNIPGNTGSGEIWKSGDEITPYMGPTPPAGVHRYVLLLYKQNGPVTPTKIEDRKSFDLAQIVEPYQLGVPVAGSYYTVKKGD